MANLERMALRATGMEISSSNGAHESLKLRTLGELSIDRLTTEGSPIGWKESSLLSTKLKELFGDYFTITGTVNIDENANPVVKPEELFGTARLLWQTLLQDGWSRERFLMALDGFVRKKHFGKDSWTPFDFRDCSPETDLHDKEWYLEQSETDREKIECYMIPGKNALMYRFPGIKLPDEFVRVV